MSEENRPFIVDLLIGLAQLQRFLSEELARIMATAATSPAVAELCRRLANLTETIAAVPVPEELRELLSDPERMRRLMDYFEPKEVIVIPVVPR